METHAPGYYTAFRCLAGECPHTCCAAGWEVPVDPRSAGLYRSLPGPLGEELRAALETDPEGEPCFPLRGGSCRFLDEKGLCRVHIALGEEATPLICRTHPRFCYDYGTLRERGLCGSCPEAARLILGEDLTLTTGTEEGPGSDAPDRLSPLLQTRETALELLAAPGEFTLAQRLQALLLFANEVQVLLDQDQAEDLPQVCGFYREEFPLLTDAFLPPREEALGHCLRVLEGLDILDPQWKALLAAGRDHPSPAPPPSPLGERSAAYFLYRHWLRGVWDGDILTWAEFAVLGTAVCSHLAPLQSEGFPGAFRLFCLELEHSEGNMAALQDVLWDKLTLAELLVIAGL